MVDWTIRTGSIWPQWLSCVFFFFQAEDGIRDLIVTGVQTCALPIFLFTVIFFCVPYMLQYASNVGPGLNVPADTLMLSGGLLCLAGSLREKPASSSKRDRKSTRLNSSHDQISYAVFCLKKKKQLKNTLTGASDQYCGGARATPGVAASLQPRRAEVTPAHRCAAECTTTLSSSR